MLRVVTPIIGSSSAIEVGILVHIHISVHIHVAVEAVVVVDVDIVAAPAAPPTPPAAPHCTHRYTDPKRNCHSRGVVPRWWVVNRGIRIYGRPVHGHRIIGGYVDHLWVSLLDDDYSLVLNGFAFNFLLLIRFQIAFL